MKIGNLSQRFLTFATLLVLAFSVSANTTSSIRGKVVTGNGASVAGASVLVEDQRTGSSRTYTTNSVGTFLASNLPVGGPYKITVNGNQTVTVDSIALGDIYNLTITTGGSAPMEEVVVYGESNQFVDVAAGPSASFSEADLRDAPAFNRDIAEVFTIDPRVNLDNEDDGFAINCGGKHPRFNSVTLDGVGLNDLFGLNENGYSTAVGMPFPYDAVQQVSVELAPFDVTYGGFSACNINSVTKSGSNEFDGNFFYEYTSDSLRGDQTGNTTITSPAYTQDKFGFSIGGPILKDKLFFFGAYEESERPRFLARGPAGSGIGEERPWMSQALFDRIENIARTVYNYDTGGAPGDGTQDEKKYMVRLDWYINDNHSLAAIYNYYDGAQLRDSDGDSSEFEFANHFYTKGAEQTTTTLKLDSQWTDALSTTVFYSANEMIDSQITVGPKDFGDHQIDTPDGNTIYLGADDSRQANALNWTADYFRVTAEYLWNDHVITAGFEIVDLEVFNQFVQHSNGGEWDYYGVTNRNGDGLSDPAYCAGLTAQGRFDDTACDLTGVDQFELGRPSRIYYGSGGGTNNAADAAANYTFATNSVFVQDEIYFAASNLTIVAGLRYDWITQDDRPTFNQAFTTANGVRNDANLDGIDILMPRLGFTWDVANDLSVRGGIGLYSGGNPNVWISNAWSNDGVTNVQVQYRDSRALTSLLSGTVPLSRQGRIGYDVPQSLVDQVAATTAASASNSFLVLLDPNYKQPSELKIALGATYDLPFWDIQMDVDYLHSQERDPAIYVDLSQTITGTTAAGQPIYSYTTGRDNFMLTNANDEGSSDLFSLVFNKSFDWGLDLTFGYAYTDAEDVNPMLSATAGSNFDNLATNDINNPVAGTSNYVVPHRFTFVARYATELFAGLTTRVAVYAYSQEGQPQSYAMGSGDLEGDGFFGRHLLYVPTGPSDPNVVFEPSFDQTAFFDWVAREGLGAGFQARNNTHAKWSRRIDLRLDQELPTFVDGTSGHLFVRLYNLGNLLNDDWGVVNDSQFFTPQVVNSSVNGSGQYVFERFTERSVNDVIESRSLWEVRLGLEFRF
ncbi:MAG: TonB-dependent receptor domain-containing protein [Pseudomonadota bacterium]